MPGLPAWSPPPPRAPRGWRCVARGCSRFRARSAWNGRRGACAAEILRHPRRHEITARPGGTDADRRAIGDRSRDTRPTSGTTPVRAPAAQSPAGRGDAGLAAPTTRSSLRPLCASPSDPLRPQPLERADPVPRRRPPRAGYQHRRARDASARSGTQLCPVTDYAQFQSSGPTEHEANRSFARVSGLSVTYIILSSCLDFNPDRRCS